ncbi:uncharacterized protein LOC126672322 [Mercurialis annua]|uniref:uncharacterized protein LOC126672322 n=1 Tax=Mercurialis annua TaxID=3986 RepID=UPI0021600EDF|nr:uncharacterized protein LOC126672322 [Mercurialis annua]
MVIVEPRVAGYKANVIIKRTGFEFSNRVEAQGFSSGIWTLWNNDIRVTILHNHKQFIHTFLIYGNDTENFFFTTVYGSPNISKRHALWNNLFSLNIDCSDPWLLAEDLNAILSSVDRKDEARLRNIGCPFFNNFLNTDALGQLSFVGPAYTWTRGTLFQRLDRGLCNNTWSTKFPNVAVHHLARISSDHRPVLINLYNQRINVSTQNSFLFLAAWLTHKDFNQVVHNCWKIDLSFKENMLHFTNNIKDWNANTFGNIFLAKKKYSFKT